MHYINLDAILSAGTAVFKGRISVLYKNTFDNDDHGTSQFYLYCFYPAKTKLLNIIINSISLVFAECLLLCMQYFHSFPVTDTAFMI